ncbi:CobW family GTP-binding protein [Nocardioides sp. Leaf374]|uniref:CobW family GTP-binding protein n=1 Tax=Nocardioides sp. Leaf374 TaxID=2876560 RepID=UPI001E3519B2|nr:GTP-binding protein [Nocardioides sp. Leaf374]
MRTPVVLVTGVSPDAMDATLVSLQWDLPQAVAVRHHIDVERQLLTRVVSDVTGVLDRAEVDLEHACVSCALREDVVPTIERLARDGRWGTVVAHLPVGADAAQVCHVLTWDARLARHLRVAGVVTAVAGPTVVDDLLGDALMAERGVATSHEDERGVGEVASGMVEHADVVVVTGEREPAGLALLRTLARPGARVVAGPELLDGALVADGLHDHAATTAWASPYRTQDVPSPDVPDVWQVDLRSDRAFHPDRLLEGLEDLGSGRHRSRGCFWLPTRPGRALEWDGAGGQLSIGAGESWGRRPAQTRLVLTGVGARPDHLEEAFEALLMTTAEEASGQSWRRPVDGFEPWLGPVREIA